MHPIKIALAGLLSLFVFHASAVDRPILHRVLIFDSENLYEGVQTYLEPTTNGRYKTKNQEPILTGGTCADLLQKFQARPLGVMEENNYISPALKKVLSDFKAQNLKARQIILLVQESEVSEAEAHSMIPNAAELEKRTTFPPNSQRKRHILLGAMWAVRGFEFDLNETRLRFHPLPVPWENSKLAQGLEKKFDREKVPFVYEIGRTLVEQKPLVGNLKLLASIMTGVIADEVNSLGIDPQKVVITGHALGSAQGRVFSAFFPYRFLNAAAMNTIEQDPKRALADYMATPALDGEAWVSLNDVVLYASLEQFINKFPADRISEMAARTEVSSDGRITGQRAKYFWRDFRNLYRRDFIFDHPELGRSPKPLIVAQINDAMFVQNFMALLTSYGMPEMKLSEPATAKPIQKLIDTPGGLNVNYTPDMFLENWESRDAILHPATDMQMPGVKPRNISYFVMNLDPKMVRKFPRLYLAAVILSLRDSVDFEITQLAPTRFLILRDKVNEDRQAQRLPPIATVDADIFFETYGLGFGDTDPLIMQELALLGGTKFKGPVMSFSGNLAKSGPRDIRGNMTLNLGITAGDLFEFKTPQLKKIAADYSFLGNNARKNLSNGNYKYRLKMMFAPFF